MGKIFKDERYIKVDNKPMLYIYNPRKYRIMIK
ncbi:glycoside hydrolase family 99-like domain-containing protein [Ligilactobacillus salivarius]